MGDQKRRKLAGTYPKNTKSGRNHCGVDRPVVTRRKLLESQKTTHSFLSPLPLRQKIDIGYEDFQVELWPDKKCPLIFITWDLKVFFSERLYSDNPSVEKSIPVSCGGYFFDNRILLFNGKTRYEKRLVALFRSGGELNDRLLTALKTQLS